MDAEAFRDLALSLPEAAQSSHLGAADFRVRGKIFAQPPGSPYGRAIIKLTREQQEMMCAAEPAVFAPEPGHWGRLGWTRLAVDAVDEVTARGALWTAWRNVAPKALARAHDPVGSATNR
ncbi:MAG TPA: MmcQ/YjbR family DNA-binding protein [Caulobacteraceae bacterium]|nr:MmcQ/YjbR family DNA-binding protein [Caulobacteraceae bacterium]